MFPACRVKSSDTTGVSHNNAREQRDTRSADRVVRLVPDAVARYRAVIDRLPRTNLPPDELSRARGLIHRLLGGRATVEQDGAGRVLARVTLDGRPLFEASGPTVSNLVAGARFGTFRRRVEIR
jgi:hypothetical protein